MRFCNAICLLAGVLLTPLTTGVVQGQAARFWLSADDVASAGPESPVYNSSVGDTETLYLWSRPIEGKRLRNFSLNLVANQTGVDFHDPGYSVFNVIDVGLSRFEFVHDSSSMPSLQSQKTQGEVVGGQTDQLLALQGFTISSDPTIRGLGPGCLPGESNCVIASDGKPAWLLGSVDFNAVSATNVELRLQIGDVGMNHESLADGDYDTSGEVDGDDYNLWQSDYGSVGSLMADGNGDRQIDAADYTIWRDNLGALGMVEPASATDVVFGVDILDGAEEPSHNAATDRSVNLIKDDYDALIKITAPATVVSIGVPEPATVWWLLALVSWLAIDRQKANQQRGR